MGKHGIALVYAFARVPPLALLSPRGSAERRQLAKPRFCTAARVPDGRPAFVVQTCRFPTEGLWLRPAGAWHRHHQEAAETESKRP